MKKYLLLFLINLLLCSSLMAQSNIAKTIQQYANTYSNDTILVYLDLQWCGASHANRDDILSFLDKMDECHKVVLMTTNYEKSFYMNLKIDTVINVSDFFKKGLMRSEMKVFSKQIKQVYDHYLPFYYFSPASVHFFKGNTYLSCINNLYKEEEKQVHYCK